MHVVLYTFDSIIAKIVSSKKSAQRIVCYFIVDSLVLVERYYSHHLKTWCFPMPQSYIAIHNTRYKCRNPTLRECEDETHTPEMGT
jgi:hypothetical protein